MPKKKAYDDELKRIEQEEEARRQAEIINRARQLAEYGVQYEPLRHAPSVTGDIAFSGLLINLKGEWEAANQARIEKENEERIAREKFEEDQKKFREEQEAFERQKREEQEAMDREKRRVEEEKRAIEQERVRAENEIKRQAELEKAREEARLKAIRDAEIEAERKRIDDERKAREEQEMLEKKKKYQAFLESIELNDTNKDQFTFIDTPEGRKFYRLVGTYKK